MFDFELARKVEALAATVKDSNPHWICTPAGEYETNNGNDWCRDCGRSMFRHLRRKDRRHAEEYYLDGGWRQEADGHRFCAHCGCWLRISLTDYGVEEELAHYRENGVGLNSIPDEAYSIDLLMSAASWGSEHEDEIQELARQLVSLPRAQEILSASSEVSVAGSPHAEGASATARPSECEAPSGGQPEWRSAERTKAQ